MNVTDAQTTTINQVGILSPWDADGEKDVWDAFKDGLTELGYPEGKGVTFVSRFGKVQTLHGNIPGDFYYMAPSVPRRSEMPRFKTWRSDVAAPVREPFEPLGGVPNGGKYVLRRHPDSSKVPP